MNLTNRRTRFIALMSLAVLAALIVIGGSVWAITAATGNHTEQQDEDQSTTADAQSPENNATTATKREEQIALDAAEIMTTWTPRTDETQTAAELRARHLMTGERASKIQEPQRSPGGDDWRKARDTNATSTPQVEIAEGTETGYVTVHARWRWVEGNGTNSWWPDERRAYHFTFTRENGEPKIADYTYETLRR